MDQRSFCQPVLSVEEFRYLRTLIRCHETALVERTRAHGDMACSAERYRDLLAAESRTYDDLHEALYAMTDFGLASRPRPEGTDPVQNPGEPPL